MVKRVTHGDLVGLKPKEANFVIEYCKDFDARRAATCSGYGADYGYKLRDQADIAAAVQYVIAQRLEASQIDAEWVLMEAVDNHILARQLGNITASNTALKLVAQHTFVDAMASDKLNVNVNADKEVMEKLIRGRQRLLERNQADDEVSFL